MARVNRSVGQYPANWPELARRVKEDAGWRCENCGAEHGPPPNVLTVAHLDNDKGNCELWNLAALCQRCHLSFQGSVAVYGLAYQRPLLPLPEWLAWRLEAMRAAGVRP